MKTTGLFTIHQYTITIDELQTPVKLIPVGDIHRYAPLHSETKFDEFVGQYRNDDKAYFLGMGDYMDFMSATERSAFLKADFHDSTQTTLDEIIREKTERFYRDIEFMKGRCIGLIEGNHYYQFKSGETSTQYLCRLLDCKYLGCATFVRLSFRWSSHNTCLDVWAHHGKGAARMIGGSLNRVQQMAESAEADIFVMGHDHRGPAGFAPKMKLTNSGGVINVIERKQLFCRSGSFLRGYVPDEISYVADACLNPANLDTIEISLIPKTRQGGNFYMDIKATI